MTSTYGLNLSSLIYDLISYFSIVIFLIILQKNKKISEIDFFVLIIFCATPFFLNNVIVHWGEFPDQKKYVDMAFQFRGLNIAENVNRNVFYSSLIYSFFPIISFKSINSIAFLNKFMIVLLFLFFQKKNISKLFLYSLVLYPSIIIYSSLSLREIMVIFFMIISAYTFFEKNYLISFTSTIFLFLIKEQYAIYLFSILLIFKFFFEFKNYKMINILLIFTLLVNGFVYQDQLIEILQSYRMGFVKEIGGYDEALNTIPDSQQNIIIMFVYAYLKSFFYPFIYELSYFKLIFFIDNILFSFLFFLNCFILFKKNKKIVFFWLINYLMINMLMSYISVNEMTLLRYKFPWVIFFIFCLSYTCKAKQFNVSSKKSFQFF